MTEKFLITYLCLQGYSKEWSQLLDWPNCRNWIVIGSQLIKVPTFSSSWDWIKKMMDLSDALLNGMFVVHWDNEDLFQGYVSQMKILIKVCPLHTFLYLVNIFEQGISIWIQVDIIIHIDTYKFSICKFSFLFYSPKL